MHWGLAQLLREALARDACQAGVDGMVAGRLAMGETWCPIYAGWDAAGAFRAQGRTGNGTHLAATGS